jgi:hypothetical protein
VGLVVFALAVLVVSSLPVLLAAMLGIWCAVVYNLWAWGRVTLWPIPKESVARARKMNWFLAALYAVLVLFG